MKIIIFGGDDVRRIENRMGSDEYSYHFVIEAFRPVLARIGAVRTVAHLDEVEPIRAECERTGQSCVILSFVPPHKTTLFMRVPLIPVFAWEYENIPYEEWDGQPKHDWRLVLQQQGKAITLSAHSAAVVRATMGEGFPAVGIPPPIFDRMEALRARIEGTMPAAQTLTFDGIVIDSAAVALSPEMTVPPVPAGSGRAVPAAQARPAGTAESSGRVVPRLSVWRRRVRRLLGSASGRGAAEPELPVPSPFPLAAGEYVEGLDLPSLKPLSRRTRLSVALDGIVYLAVLDPTAARKNFLDILTAFTWALRDAGDATLAIKIVASDPSSYWEMCWNNLQKQPAFRCRVVMIDAFLDEDGMSRLLQASSYVVNCACAEGCALPLLEGMSVGRPAIAPDHTAMAEYVDPSSCFIVSAHMEATAFPHDSRVCRRTLWHMPRWDTLGEAFRKSYGVARNDPERWLAMSQAAVESQRRFCRDELVERSLRDFLGVGEQPPSLTRWGRDLSGIGAAAPQEAEV